MHEGLAAGTWAPCRVEFQLPYSSPGSRVRRLRRARVRARLAQRLLRVAQVPQRDKAALSTRRAEVRLLRHGGDAAEAAAGIGARTLHRAGGGGRAAVPCADARRGPEQRVESLLLRSFFPRDLRVGGWALSEHGRIVCARVGPQRCGLSPSGCREAQRRRAEAHGVESPGRCKPRRRSRHRQVRRR